MTATVNEKTSSYAYNSDAYYYMKNAQGDVTGIADSNLNVITEYSYDAWDKLIDTTGNAANFIGKLNPFLYRGYHFSTRGLYVKKIYNYHFSTFLYLFIRFM